MDSPAQPPELLGVTRLVDTCGHIFCRKELSANSVTLILCRFRCSTCAGDTSLLTWIRARVSFKCDGARVKDRYIYSLVEFILSALSRLAHQAICRQGGRLGSEAPHPRSLPLRK